MEEAAERRALGNALVEHGKELAADLLSPHKAHWLDFAPAADMLLEALAVAGFVVLPKRTFDGIPAMLSRVDAAFSHEAHDAERADLYAIYRWAESVHATVHSCGPNPAATS